MGECIIWIEKVTYMISTIVYDTKINIHNQTIYRILLFYIRTSSWLSSMLRLSPGLLIFSYKNEINNVQFI